MPNTVATKIATNSTRVKSKTSNSQNEFKLGATGKRKASVARVFISYATEDIQHSISINSRTVEDFFSGVGRYVSKIKKPFLVSELDISKYCISVNVFGGGLTGCADSIMLGISRVLAKMSESSERSLKKAKLLTRDSRVVESKKYGKRKARRSEQFSKR